LPGPSFTTSDSTQEGLSWRRLQWPRRASGPSAAHLRQPAGSPARACQTFGPVICLRGTIDTPDQGGRHESHRTGSPDYGRQPWIRSGLCPSLGRRRLGFLAGSLLSARQANARVDAVICAMPTAARAPLYLESHGGSISLGPINEADGTRRQGVIAVPGGLHLDTPWTSTDGAKVIPIR
jgi:hypothetical protein